MPDDAAIPTLDSAAIAMLESLGTRRAVDAGDYLYRQGDESYDFYVVLSGTVEILVDSDGGERVIARHGPGRFLGELNLLTGMRVFLSARVVEPGEILAISREGVRHVITTCPRLSDLILAACLARRTLLLTGAAESIRVVAPGASTEAIRIREYLTRSWIPYEWLDPEHDVVVEHTLRQLCISPHEFPVVVTRGSVLRGASRCWGRQVRIDQASCSGSWRGFSGCAFGPPVLGLRPMTLEQAYAAILLPNSVHTRRFHVHSSQDAMR